MTNLAIIVTLLTNRAEYLHPSGREKKVVTVIMERHRVEYQWHSNVIVFETNVPLSTNWSKMVWAEVPAPPVPR